MDLVVEEDGKTVPVTRMLLQVPMGAVESKRKAEGAQRQEVPHDNAVTYLAN